MDTIEQDIQKNRKYLKLLAKEYPNLQSVSTEIINLRAILQLPKGTEHFMSDLHGEHEAFAHILNNCSGVVREKVDILFAETLDKPARSELCTLIYYPKQKLELFKERGIVSHDWYAATLRQLTAVCKLIASKYTRSKVRKALPCEFGYIIDELLHIEKDENQRLYNAGIFDSIISVDSADEFICALSSLIKRLAVDRLHIVGDIFDRGPRPDGIIRMLMDHHSVDIQWGNHDILWMGAAAGSEACIAAVLNNCATYNRLEVLEQGYGINLRPIALFADAAYPDSKRFTPRAGDASGSKPKEVVLISKLHKAIAVILFKLEGQLIARRPDFGMDDRCLLHRIDYQNGTIEMEGEVYPLTDSFFPTVDPADPYRLTAEEQDLLYRLKQSFTKSDRLNRHIRFLYSSGSMYKVANQNLLFHGCIPLHDNGDFMEMPIDGNLVKGRALMDAADTVARQAYFTAEGDPHREYCLDFMYYLWCGRGSPLFGRNKITTFERLFIDYEALWEEKKNSYYIHCEQEEKCVEILEEFGLNSDISHIINGHIPVRASRGESPVKAGGKLIVIDGGFCRAYHPRTGIAGYTLIYNSYGLRLMEHQPFENSAQAVSMDSDIESTPTVFETVKNRVLVMDTDTGNDLSNKIYDLSLLLTAYRKGIIQQKESHLNS